MQTISQLLQHTAINTQHKHIYFCIALDSKLVYNKHINNMAARALETLLILKDQVGKKQGDIALDIQSRNQY